MNATARPNSAGIAAFAGKFPTHLGKTSFPGTTRSFNVVAPCEPEYSTD